MPQKLQQLLYYEPSYDRNHQWYLFSDKTCLCTNLHIKNFRRGKGSGKLVKLEIEKARSKVDGTHKHAKYKRTQHRHDRLQIKEKINTQAQNT